jgi:proteic killer suppression protein
MLIERFRHKGLRRLYDDDDPRGLPTQSVPKIKAILAALDSAADLSQVDTMPGWKLHPLKGDRRGQYGITVTANHRITFRLRGNTVTDVDFEDYH